MARRGVLQLQKLFCYYSDIGGSSRGMRAFLESGDEGALGRLRRAAPGLDIELQMRRSRHPKFRAEYVNGTVKTVDVPNLDASKVEWHARMLQSESGYKMTKLGSKKLTHRPSIQGMWEPPPLPSKAAQNES